MAKVLLFLDSFHCLLAGFALLHRPRVQCGSCPLAAGRHVKIPLGYCHYHPLALIEIDGSHLCSWRHWDWSAEVAMLAVRQLGASPPNPFPLIPVDPV